MRLSPEVLDVDPAKLMRYLLAHDHPDGRSKARFFQSIGFSAERLGDFAEALRQHAQSHEGRIEPSPFGDRIVVEGALSTPTRRPVFVRSVWFRDTDSTRVRLVTAYPIRP